jgi:hypothetical protein
MAEGNGFAFDAQSRTWQPIADSPLAPRAFPASAWTGEELLVWGGADARQERFFGDGAAYDPENGTWRTLPEPPIGARAPLSVWTGDELVVWGTGLRMHPRPRDGAAYDPATNSWRTISEAPIELTDATAVWTGREMIAFGAPRRELPGDGVGDRSRVRPRDRYLAEAARLDALPAGSTAAWTDRELVAWDYLNGTAAYDPAADRWRTLADVPLNSGECSPESVSVGGWVLGNYCGLHALYDPAIDRWDALAGVEIAGWWDNELVRAGQVVLLLGRNADTDQERMLAYCPG